MTESLRKEIMLHSKLRKRFLKTKTEESKQLHNKQQNLCVTLCSKRKEITVLSGIAGFSTIIENFGKQ